MSLPTSATNKMHFLPVSSICLFPADIEQLISPCVYFFLRGDEILYIGRGLEGLQRPVSPNHHRRNAREEADRVLIYFFQSREAAIDAETTLIEHFSPKYNVKKARSAVSIEEQRENLASIKKARLLFVKILGHSDIPVSHNKLLNWTTFRRTWNTARKDYGEEVLLAALEAWLTANKLWLQGKEVRNGRSDGYKRGLYCFLKQSKPFLEDAKQKAAA